MFIAYYANGLVEGQPHMVNGDFAHAISVRFGYTMHRMGALRPTLGACVNRSSLSRNYAGMTSREARNNAVDVPQPTY